jgi:hypothetical protein
VRQRECDLQRGGRGEGDEAGVGRHGQVARATVCVEASVLVKTNCVKRSGGQQRGCDA